MRSRKKRWVFSPSADSKSVYTVLATRRIARICLETGEAEEICDGDMIAGFKGMWLYYLSDMSPRNGKSTLWQPSGRGESLQPLNCRLSRANLATGEVQHLFRIKGRNLHGSRLPQLSPDGRYLMLVSGVTVLDEPGGSSTLVIDIETREVCVLSETMILWTTREAQKDSPRIAPVIPTQPDSPD